jgi:hypothetical protein
MADINNRVILGSLRYKFSPDVDFGVKLPLSQSSSEMPEYDRSVDVSLSQLYDDERQASTVFRPTGKFNLIFQNGLVGKCVGTSPYAPFNNNLYYLDETISASVQCGNGGSVVGWSGFPQYNEFDFIRTDYGVYGYTTTGKTINDYHVKFVPQSASSYNWMYYLTYPYDNDYTKDMMAEDSDGNMFNWVCADGIPFVIQNTTGYGQRLITFKCPMKHGLSIGEYVKLNFDYDGNDVFAVYSLGNGFSGSEEYIFNLYNVGYTGVTFTTGTQGTFRRLLNPLNSGETLSKYYVRKHKVVSLPQDSVVVKAGFELNSFKLQRKYYSDAYTPNFRSRIATKEGSQAYTISFNGDVNIDGLVDNQKRPITELFFSVIWRGYFGWTMRTSNSGNPNNGDPLLEGWEFNLPPKSSGKPSTWWSKTNTNSRTKITTNYYTTPTGGSAVKFTYNEFLSTGDTINGDFCEWNDYEINERVISDYYHKFKFNPGLFTIIGGNNINLPGYYYKPHYSIKIRQFSDYIETGLKTKTEGIPDYATYSPSQLLFRWRDLYPYGFIDPTGIGVDYPFTNGKHYPYENMTFKIIPEGFFNINNNLVSDPTIDGCE